MVRHAFRVLTDDKIKTRLLAFSDDMDGLRKVPDNVPNKEHAGGASRQAADACAGPVLNEYPSFGAHNNARLRAFLDTFGFDYEFASSTDYYTSGKLRCGAAADARAARQGHGDHAAVAARGARARATRRSCRSASAPGSRAPGADDQRMTPAGTVSYDDPDTKERVDASGHRRELQAAMEGGLGDALGTRSASTMKWPARI